MAALLLSGAFGCAGVDAPLIPPSAPPVRDPAFIAAEDLERAGRLEQARESFQALRRRDPDFMQAFAREVALTKEPQAVLALEGELDELDAATADPARRAVLRTLKAALATMVSDKERLLEEALRLDPDCALARMALADLLEERGDDEKALVHWRRAAETPGAPPEAQHRMALALIARQEHDEAIRRLAAYLERVPDDALANYNLGTLLVETRRNLSSAYQHLSHAAELRPRDVNVLMNAATAALLIGREQSALDFLKRAKLVDPDDPDIYFNLAVLHADYLGDPESAISNFDTYLRLGGADRLRVGRWLDELRAKVKKK